jgi:hypothetical protein
MQKQTIIKEATTLAQAQAGREREYVHFYIEQRVPVHFHIEQNFTGEFISNQYQHQHQHQQEHQHLHQYQHHISIRIQYRPSTFLFFPTDGIVSCIVLYYLKLSG